MTEIIEVDLPCWVLPTEPYYIKELELVILPIEQQLPDIEYYVPCGTIRIIFYGKELLEVKLKEQIFSIVKFKCFLYPDTTLYHWLINKTFINQLKARKEINDLESYVNQIYKKKDFIEVADYNKYPLLEISSKRNNVNFREKYLKFINLDSKNAKQLKIKELIEYYSFIITSSALFGSIYKNENFKISNIFSIIESLINLEIEDQSGYRICPSCKEKIPFKKSMNELIEEFIRKQNLNENNKTMFIKILKKHYSTRNTFSHDVKYLDVTEKTKEIAIKNNNVLSLDNEIKYANAGFTGLYHVNSLIRLIILDKLDNLST